MKALSIFVATVVGTASIGSASAQADPQIFADAMVSTGLNVTMINALNAQAKPGGRHAQGGRRPISLSATAARTRFTPDPARRRGQASRFLGAVGKLSPDLQKSLAPAFRGDPVAYARPFLAKYGMRTDDVADLTATYLVTSWYGAHSRTGDPTRGEVTAVRDQIRGVYRASPKLRAASNATKQDAGEGSLYLAFLNDALSETMRAHPEAKAKLAAIVAGVAKATFGVDLRRMRLTPSGLVG